MLVGFCFVIFCVVLRYLAALPLVVLGDVFMFYRNDPKFSDSQAWANSADPDQTIPRGAV